SGAAEEKPFKPRNLSWSSVLTGSRTVYSSVFFTLPGLPAGWAPARGVRRGRVVATRMQKSSQKCDQHRSSEPPPRSRLWLAHNVHLFHSLGLIRRLGYR